MKTYCITGVCGYIGSLLAKKLLSLDNTKVIGIDKMPSCSNPGVAYYSRDIRRDGLSVILEKEKVDTFIHLAFYTPPEGNVDEAFSINIEGTKAVLSAVEKTNIKRFVLASSAAAYGSHDDNPLPFKENHPLRPNDFFYYSTHKAEQEKLVHDFGVRNPHIQVVTLRPCVVIGPHINNDTGKTMRQKVLVNIRNPMVPIQLIYEDDVAEAFYCAAVGTKTGTYNVGTSGTVTFKDVGKALRKPVILLPYRMLLVLASIAKFIKASPVGWRTLRFIKNPIVVDPSRFWKDFNFQPKFDSLGALRQFADTLG